MFQAIWHELEILSRLTRLRMTIFSAVTYSVAYTIGLRCGGFQNYTQSLHMDISQFLIGWTFILSCQISAHLLGEYYDLAADKLCRHASPFTGGSRVLVKDEYSAQRCHILGWMSALLAVSLLFALLPSNTHLVGIVMVVLSTQYSGFPLRLNHHALGELCAALVMNILLPYFSAMLATANSDIASHRSSLFLSSNCANDLAMLIVPSVFVKFALFLVLNLADLPSDAAAGKITLPVLLGENAVRKLHALTMIAAYAGSIVVYLACSSSLLSLVMVLATAFPAYPICLALLSNAQPIQPLVLPSLKHAPLLVIVIFLESFVREILHSKSLLHVFLLEFQLRCLPLYPYVYTLVAPLFTRQKKSKVN